MTKLILAALAAFTIAGPVAITTNSTEPQPNNEYIAKYLPSDMRGDLENISNVLYGEADRYLAPVNLWLEEAPSSEEVFTLFKNNETMSVISDSQLKELKDSIFIDYLIASAIASGPNPSCRLECTRGTLDYLVPLSTYSEEVVYYLEQLDYANFYTSARNIYNGLCSIYTDIIESDLDDVIDGIRMSYRSVVKSNQEAGITVDNYCEQLRRITYFANRLSESGDSEADLNNAKLVLSKYEEFIDAGLYKTTVKELLGFEQEEFDSYYDLTPEEQEEFCNKYYPNYINSVLYYFLETYRIKASYERNRKFGEMLNDLTFPSSYKLLDILEMVQAQERFPTIENAVDLINNINYFEKYNFSELTVNPSFPDRQSFIILVEQDYHLLSAEYNQRIARAKLALKDNSVSFENIKANHNVWKTKKEVSLLDNNIDDMKYIAAVVTLEYRQTNLRSNEATQLLAEINWSMKEMEDYKDQIIAEYNRVVITLIICVSIVTILAGGLVTFLVIYNKKKKEKTVE